MSRPPELDPHARGAASPRRPVRPLDAPRGRPYRGVEDRAGAASPRSTPTAEGVLFVCTGNICRSVIAETIFQSRADMAGWPLTAASAGLTGAGAQPPRHAAAVMRRRGIDVSTHRSRRLDGSMIDSSAVVIGSSPEHVWAAAVLRPDASRRLFTLKELVRFGELAKRTALGEGLGSWVAHVDEVRRRRAPETHGNDDTIDDPKGKNRRTYQRVALEVERLVLQLVDLLTPAMTPLKNLRAATPRTEVPLPGVP